MDWAYESRDNGWLLVHGGLATMGQHGRSGARQVIVTAQREREKEEEVIEVLTNDATWRQSCGDSHPTMLNKGGRWCSDREMVPDVRRRDWSWGGCGG
jgi:hypothetical protein